MPAGPLESMEELAPGQGGAHLDSQRVASAGEVHVELLCASDGSECALREVLVVLLRAAYSPSRAWTICGRARCIVISVAVGGLVGAVAPTRASPGAPGRRVVELNPRSHRCYRGGCPGRAL